MTRWITLICLVAFLTIGAWAQGAGGGNIIRDLLAAVDTTGAVAGASATAMEVTAKGVFVMRAGTVAKLDGKTLEQQGAIELLGPMPERPAGRDRAAQARYQAETAKRRQPAAWLFTETDVIVVMANTFFRIDPVKFEVKAKTDLADPNAVLDPNANPNVNFAAPAAPILKLAEKVLYILQDTKIAEVDIVEGKVLARGVLPAAMQPAPRRNPGGLNPQPMPTDPAVPAADTAVVGMMVNHPELEGGFWTVRLDNADEYVLAGAQLEKLLAVANIEGKRVRLTGKVSTRAGLAMFGKGYFDVAAFQVLPDAEPIAEG